MSNCNDDYEQIRKKLSECNRDVKYIFVQVLAGPTEPQGDAGIQRLQGEIGTTGPRVEKGDVGPAGPRGFPGEIWISEVITIDGTETVEPNEEAQVQDDFDRNIHHLTFYIPKVEKGDKGETGSSELTLYNALCLEVFPKLRFQGALW